jgi:hypothetical protein
MEVPLISAMIIFALLVIENKLIDLYSNEIEKKMGKTPQKSFRKDCIG